RDQDTQSARMAKRQSRRGCGGGRLASLELDGEDALSRTRDEAQQARLLCDPVPRAAPAELTEIAERPPAAEHPGCVAHAPGVQHEREDIAVSRDAGAVH